MSKTETVLATDSFASSARSYLIRKAGFGGVEDAVERGFEPEFANLVEPGRRFVRLTVWDVSVAPRRVRTVLETGEDLPPAHLHAWALEECGWTDAADPELVAITGHDPRRVSGWIADAVREVAEDLLEVRIRLDGLVEAARECGLPVDAELATELSDAVESVRTRAEDVSDV